MNIKSLVVAFGLVSVSAVGFSADNSIADDRHASAPRTRAEVKAETQQAINNGELHRTPLADLQDLTDNRQRNTTPVAAVVRDQPIQELSRR